MVPQELFSLDDNDLIRMTLEGNSKAFGEIIRRYQNAVARTVKGMLGDIQQADDVGQETFIRLYNSIGEFRGDSRLGTYIQRIAINLSLNEIKRMKRFTSLFHPAQESGEHDAVEVPAENIESSDDYREIVTLAISKLTPEFRSVVTMRMLQGYSTKETADILNLPLGTVLSRLARAKEQLKVILEKLN